MIVVTGGAGFIGSNIIATLIEHNVEDVVVCDEFGEDDKWRNLHRSPISGVVHPDDLAYWLETHASDVKAIIHCGAISSTTEKDVDLILDVNFSLPLDLWKWCAENNVRFIYCSSAATYGDGSLGFDDDQSLEALGRLRPLNPYGWSKSLFDLRAAFMAEKGKPTPPQWVGLKFFNVYGPNEYHKGSQMSVARQLFPHAQKNLPVKLFKSENPDYKHGEQKRDFIYVKDCCDVIVWLLANQKVSGIFNVGTGKARTFNDLADALFSSLGHKEARIDYIDMPVELHDRYQYLTEAKMDKLKAAGYDKPFTSLEDGVNDYVTNYLVKEDKYR